MGDWGRKQLKKSLIVLKINYSYHPHFYSMPCWLSLWTVERDLYFGHTDQNHISMPFRVFLCVPRLLDGSSSIRLHSRMRQTFACMDVLIGCHAICLLKIMALSHCLYLSSPGSLHLSIGHYFILVEYYFYSVNFLPLCGV